MLGKTRFFTSTWRGWKKKYKRGGVWGVKRKSKMFAEKIKETENQM